MERWRKYPRLAAYWASLARQNAMRVFAAITKPADYEGRLAEEARRWSEGGRGHTWLDSPLIQSRINRLISGDPDVYWLLHFKRRFAPAPLQRALNLGCGAGGLERNALSIGLAEFFDSFDISPQSMENGQEDNLSRSEVNRRVADINKIELEKERYEAAFAVNILHHLVELEHVFEEVRRSLRPGGLFVIHEYAGPKRFQWSDGQLDEINSALRELPRRYRRNRRRRRGVKTRVYRPLLDETNPDSPFEAVRSDEILPLLEERFERVERVDLGGALLHPLLEAIVANFDERLELDRRILESLWEREKDLMSRGMLGNDFVYAVFRRPDN